MKKFVVILLCSIGLLQTGLSQNTKYKFYTLGECKNDTLAFFFANYGYNWIDYSRNLVKGVGERYDDCPLRVLIDEAKGEGVVFKSFRFRVTPVGYVTLYLNVLPKEKAEETMKDDNYPHLCVQVTIGRWYQEPYFTSREQNVFYDIDDEFLDSIAPKKVIELQPYFSSYKKGEKYRRMAAEIQKSKK